MKRNLLNSTKRGLLIAAAALLFGQHSWAQVGSPPCQIRITGSFEPACLYDTKPGAVDEYEEELIACRGGRVTYRAQSVSGTAAGWDWGVSGATSHTASGDRVTVHWGTGAWGMLTVAAVNAAGETCVESRRVRLVDVPAVGSATLPAYTVNAYGEKVIRVCRGSSIEFVDQSSGGDSDIAGHVWEGYGRTQTTANFTLEDVQEGGKVSHQVYNNCGCSSDEVYFIEVEEGEPLELKCYGTVCENARVTYTLHDLPCHEYMWYVEGGTLVSGQGTPSPTVVWDRPSDGYGVLGLDGALCGEVACPMLMSRKVPVVHGGLAIAGPTDLCAGESVEYTLPLLGSTRYEWSVSPSAGVDVSLVNQSHRARLVFNAPGTYTLEAAYRCDFLDCGYYQSQPLTVQVKPALEIEGESEVCETNACTLTVSPAVAATWRVYDDAGVQVGPAETGSTFVRTFPGAGRYVVEARHPSYCRTAMHAMTVRAAPPAPTLADLDPDNRHVACPGQGLVLRGTPASPAYSLMWDPVSASASPHGYAGNEVTVSYGSVVSDVQVYHYDRRLGCRSEGYAVHTVEPLELQPIVIQQPVLVCPGTVVDWSTGVVPDQSADGVLYEWKIQPTMQHCASVQGSHLGSGAVLTVHNLSSPQADFYVLVRRTVCGGTVEDTIRIEVRSGIAESLALNCPGPICEDDEALLSASGGDVNTYRWHIENSTYTGSPVSHIFGQSGDIPVTLRSNPYNYCSNEDYHSTAVCTVRVNPRPPLRFVYYDRTTGRLTTEPAFGAGYTVEWQWKRPDGFGYWMDGGTGSSVVPSGDGTYRCTVTDLATGCTATDECGYMPPPCPSTAAIPLTHTVDYCTGTATVTASVSAPGATLSWSVKGGAEPSPGPGHSAIVSVPHAGTYLVEVQADQLPCHLGQKMLTVDFVPDFEVVAECNRIVILNRSTYLGSGSNLVYMSVDGVPVSFPVSQESYAYTAAAGTHTVALQGYGPHSFAPCPENTFTVETVSPLASVSISTANTAYPNQTCDNTPILLTATTTPARSVAFAEWTFGDHSSFGQAGASISHTYAWPGQSPYNLTVLVTDNYGCKKHSDTYPIRSNPDALAGGALEITSPIVCPGGTRNLEFQPDATSSPWNHYHWEGSPVPVPGNQYATHYSKDYSVYVVNDHYCQKEASLFVPFLNPPVADIYVENTTGCEGQPMHLSGDNGPGANVTYTWDVDGPSPFYETYSTPTVNFTPPVPGTSTVTLYVSNGTCSATDVETLTINALPAAPTLSFIGSPCISDAPVRVGAAGFSGEMHWSNGDTGPTAHCYYPGPLVGWYFDPLLGCPSAKAEIHIDRQPDFDALLTGCYTGCPDFFPRDVPVYGFTDPQQTIQWQWMHNGAVEATGWGNYHPVPLSLPVAAPGEYRLSVDYANGSCSELSPSLFIDYRDTCPCENVDFEIERTLNTEGCSLVWTVDITVHNNSATDLCIGELVPLFNTDEEILVHRIIIYDSYIAPGGTGRISMEISPLTLNPSVALFETDLGCGCVLSIAVDLMPETDCKQNTESHDVSLNTGLTTPGSVYLDFHMHLPVEGVYTVGSTPPMVVDWWYDGLDHAGGLLMLDPARLSRLAEENGLICIEALACAGGEVCRYSACIDAHELWTHLVEQGFGGAPGEWLQYALPQPHSGALTLVPNPATGLVTVAGTADEVAEVVLIDMYGRKVATHTGTTQFDVDGLAAGAYIVRLKTRPDTDSPEQTTYLKLIVR